VGLDTKLESGGIKIEDTSKRPKKKKRATKKTFKDKAWRAFSKYIRLRDALKTTGTITHVKCITCGKLLTISFCDAGHFVSRRHNSTLFDERNVNTQCRYCNRFLNGNLLEYRRQIIKLYGEGADIEIEDKATEICKFSAEDLTRIEKYYKMRVKEIIE
jgi:hypothetical protein